MSDFGFDASDSVTVFCQLTGNTISTASCLQTQGQDGCFGCASSVRHCVSCDERYAVLPSTGTCTTCTKRQLSEEKTTEEAKFPERVTCQMMEQEISTVMCQSMQGQDECRNCTAPSRICERCQERPVMFGEYGYCLACTVAELESDWQPEERDREVAQIGGKDTFDHTRGFGGEQPQPASCPIASQATMAAVLGSTEWLIEAAARIPSQTLTDGEMELLSLALQNLQTVTGQLEAYGAVDEYPPRFGEIWTPEETARITTNNQHRDTQLAAELERTVGSIRARRRKLFGV